MDQILELGNKLLRHLESRGLEVEASAVKEAMQGFYEQTVGRRPGLPRRKPYGGPQEVAIRGPEKGLAVGEKYEELSPATGETKEKLYKMPNVFTFDQLLEAIERGFLSSKYFLDKMQKAKTFREKEFYRNLYEMAEKQQAELGGKKPTMTLANRLASISQVLDSKGYDMLSRRLFELSSKIAAKDDVVERHKALSLESVYEESSDVRDFQKNVDRMVSMYEGMLREMKNFQREYKDQILKALDQKKISEEEAVKKAVDMVRDTDRTIHAKTRALAEKVATSL